MTLFTKFKEPRIRHDKIPDPFDFSEGSYESKYFYDLNFSTSYRNFVKIVNYKTEQYFTFKNYENTMVYLEDIYVSSKIENDTNIENIIGSFRLSLSKKKDIFARIYSYWDEFIAKVFGHISGVQTLFGIISLVFVNMNDNLRIFDSLFEKRPYLYEQTKEIINEYCRRKNKKEIVENVIKEKH